MANDTSSDLSALFIAQSRHFLRTEYPTKLRAAVKALPADAIWWRANATSNSVGNLLLHLTGNVRQWIVGGIGGAAVIRDRAGEFGAQSGATADTLLDDLDRALDDVDAVLAKLTAADLMSQRTIQGRELIVLDAIYHVVEHFSLHLGQIILVAKLHAPGAVKFYEDAGGMARPLWPAMVKTQA
jgi:uncharacterized damage-inducible protein DinB